MATMAVSAGAHPGAAWLYEATREIPDPMLRVVVGGDGAGVVSSVPTGILCGTDCAISLERGSLVKLTATIGEGSTFEGWQGPCGSQAHVLFEWTSNLLYPYGAPPSDGDRGLYDFLEEASDKPLAEHPLDCEVFLDRSTEIVAQFGVPPERVEVAMLSEPTPQTDEEETTLSLPKVALLPDEILDLTEELEELAEPEPEPVPVIPLPTPMVAAEPPPPAPKIAAAPKMKSVETPDENEVEAAPDDARFLSDKNRDVAEETHATETNLSKQSDGERVASAESDITSDQVGGEEEEIAQLEELEETAMDVDREVDDSSGSEEGEVVVRHSGEDGTQGDDGESGDDSPSETPGLLAMRNIEGRGALGSSGEPAEEVESDPGSGGSRGKRGKKGRAGPKLRLEQEDYERIVGKEVADKERAVARRKQSRRRGRWERKLGMLKSSLENFTPSVRPSNQTALKTRAAPFAVYIARMHRRIHELWGFGFLGDLDGKSSSHELNNWNLATKLEIIINPDGSIDKMTIVEPSGILSFDVAALDVIDTAGPYESTPSKIRSPDGKVYMHWSFHRDWRQCGTFGAEPFILASPPRGGDRGLDDSQLLRNNRKRRAKRAAPAPSRSDAVAASARATANLATPRDPAAQHTANLWLAAFVAGNHAKLAKISAGPFHSGGRVVAKTSADIAAIYKTVIGELSSRRIRDWKLLSAAGYRRSFGALPSGLDARGAELFLVIKLGGDIITLVLENGQDGYRVTGLYR
ncbi:MAG: hypothetical protein GY811_18600 [Myxococcales bacterium]|nr:hypothetical protein [Myxococcales bacterium]